MKAELISIDLPVLSQRDDSFNVNFRGINVYVAVGTHGLWMCLPSTDLAEPKYQGGFLDLYPRHGESLRQLLTNRLGEAS